MDMPDREKVLEMQLPDGDAQRAAAVAGVVERSVRGSVVLMLRGAMGCLQEAGVAEPLVVLADIVVATSRDVEDLFVELGKSDV